MIEDVCCLLASAYQPFSSNSLNRRVMKKLIAEMHYGNVSVFVR